MNKVAIVHGTKGSPQGNWFPWLANELRAKYHEVIVPQMPTPEGQLLENWKKAFTAAVGKLDSSTVLVGHSIGATFLLRFLEKAMTPVRATVLAAGFTGTLGLPEYDLLNSSFVTGPYDWDRIRQNAGKVICYSGANDPYVPLSQGLEIAKNLKVEANVIKDGGHLNAEFGYLSFPRLLEDIENVLVECQ